MDKFSSQIKITKNALSRNVKRNVFFLFTRILYSCRIQKKKYRQVKLSTHNNNNKKPRRCKVKVKNFITSNIIHYMSKRDCKSPKLEKKIYCIHFQFKKVLYWFQWQTWNEIRERGRTKKRRVKRTRRSSRHNELG